MKLQTLLDGARYLGQAEGDRKAYSVFDTDNHYLLLGPTQDGYFLNLVDKDSPEVITKAFAGKKVTAGEVRKNSKRPDLFDKSFASLSALYVMVALRRARKLKQRRGKSLVFKIK
jgi:hypothetical protein